jgi:hypothetical protein
MASFNINHNAIRDLTREIQKSLDRNPVRVAVHAEPTSPLHIAGDAEQLAVALFHLNSFDQLSAVPLAKAFESANLNEASGLTALARSEALGIVSRDSTLAAGTIFLTNVGVRAVNASIRPVNPLVVINGNVTNSQVGAGTFVTQNMLSPLALDLLSELCRLAEGLAETIDDLGVKNEIRDCVCVVEESIENPSLSRRALRVAVRALGSVASNTAGSAAAPVVFELAQQVLMQM